jgi:hypothetical protein
MSELSSDPERWSPPVGGACEVHAGHRLAGACPPTGGGAPGARMGALVSFFHGYATARSLPGVDGLRLRGAGVVGGLVVALVASALPFVGAGPSKAAETAIRDVRISGSSMAFSSTKQAGVPIARFSVALPDDATRLTYVYFQLRRYTRADHSKYAFLLVNGGCMVPTIIACSPSDSGIDVTITLRIEKDWWSAALQHPGTFHPYIFVYTDSPTQTDPVIAELSTPTVMVRRMTRMRAFNAGPEPVNRGSKVTIEGRLQRTLSCNTDPPNEKCDALAWGYWSNYSARQVRVYFDPAGARGPVYRGSLTTNGKGKYRGRFTAHRSGRWYVRFANNSTHAKSLSRMDRVAAN